MHFLPILLLICHIALAGPPDKGPAIRPKAIGQPAREEDFYQILSVQAPDGVQLEVGGLAMMPDGKLACATRRGQVWIISNPGGELVRTPTFSLFATGLHEPLGLAYRDGALYTAQRGELTKLTDTDQDGQADRYETVSLLPISGNYHEYAFGPSFDKAGNAYISLNVGFFDPLWFLGVARVPYRGWVVKITPEGQMQPYAAGVRSPAGIYVSRAGDVLYGENQGDFVGSGWITELKSGDFAGHPAGLAWADQPGSPVKARPADVTKAANGQTLWQARAQVPGLKTPAVWFPHGIMGISTCGIVELTDDSSFGPFGGQYLIGDQGQSKLMRMDLERVDGVLQGSCFDFRSGFASGVLRMEQAPGGQLYVGQTNRGWASAGPEPFALQRLRYAGGIPFEIRHLRARRDGFELELTRPAHEASAADLANFAITSFAYKYHSTYGSPVINSREHRVLGAKVSADGLHVRLVIDSLEDGNIYEIKATGLLSPGGEPLLHDVGYYTLNKIPSTGEALAYTPMPRTLAPAAKAGAQASAKLRKALGIKEEVNADAQPATVAGTKTPPEAKAAMGKPGVLPPSTLPKPAAPAALAKHTTALPAGWGKPDMVLSVSTKAGLKFEPALQQVRPGAKVKMTFINADDMTHNWVLVAPGQAVPVGEQAMKLGLQGTKLNYIPKTDKVLAHTLILQPQTSESVYFIAPTKPGDYTYVCTLPGHFYTMQGTLRVK